MCTECVGPYAPYTACFNANILQHIVVMCKDDRLLFCGAPGVYYYIKHAIKWVFGSLPSLLSVKIADLFEGMTPYI